MGLGATEPDGSIYDAVMVFRVPTGEGTDDQSHVDYRLAKAATVREYRHGYLTRADVCDAHPELRRAAHQLGTRAPGECPVCDATKLVHVTYVFGPRLPRHGRCISLRGELERLAQRPGLHVAYVVEVCRECSWNHLVRRSNLSGDSSDSTAGVATTAEAGDASG